MLQRKSDGRELKHKQVAFKASHEGEDGSFKG